MRARDVMTRWVITVRPDASVKEIADKLSRHRVSAVPVVDDEEKLLGVVSEIDLLPQVAGIRRAGDGVPHTAADVMSRRIVTVAPDTDVREVAKLLLRHRLRRLPVVEDGRVVGIVSRGDLIGTFVRKDAAIESELRKLLDDKIEVIGRFTVAVHEGIAVLSGHPDASDRRLARLLAETVPGVIGVQFGALGRAGARR
jgi:predicted transcriptional regulator